MGGGHYTAYCKYGDQWYNCDDSSIAALGTNDEAESRIKSKSAYLLFYKRKSARVDSITNHYSSIYTVNSPQPINTKKRNIIDSDDDSMYNNASGTDVNMIESINDELL